MIHVVLYEPEIPPNTGNLIRLCANTGIRLHLIEPLGFSLDEKRVRRAGLDYQDMADVHCHPDLGSCLTVLPATSRVFAATTKATELYTSPDYRAGDAFLFGPESRGLPESILASPAVTARIRIPMKTPSRSLNLSNAVSIIAYETLRQLNFEGLTSLRGGRTTLTD